MDEMPGYVPLPPGFELKVLRKLPHRSACTCNCHSPYSSKDDGECGSYLGRSGADRDFNGAIRGCCYIGPAPNKCTMCDNTSEHFPVYVHDGLMLCRKCQKEFRNG